MILSPKVFLGGVSGDLGLDSVVLKTASPTLSAPESVMLWHAFRAISQAFSKDTRFERPLTHLSVGAMGEMAQLSGMLRTGGEVRLNDCCCGVGFLSLATALLRGQKPTGTVGFDKDRTCEDPFHRARTLWKFNGSHEFRCQDVGDMSGVEHLISSQSVPTCNMAYSACDMATDAILKSSAKCMLTPGSSFTSCVVAPCCYDFLSAHNPYPSVLENTDWIKLTGLAGSSDLRVSVASALTIDRIRALALKREGVSVSIFPLTSHSLGGPKWAIVVKPKRS